MPPTATAEPPAKPSMELGTRGAVTEKIIRLITERLPPEKIAEKLDELIHATRMTKHGEVIDTRSVEAGVKLWLAYAIGLPVQRSEAITVALDADSTVGIEERLAKSPALREQLRRSLAAADAAAGVVEVS